MLCLSHMRNFIFSSIAVSALLFFIIPGTYLYAQVPNFGNQTNPSVLVLSPQYPEPNETITATLNDFSVNTSGASIQWFIDGKEVPDSKNNRAIEFSTGALGSSLQVLAVTTLPNGSVLRAEKRIRPVRLDILIEADTRVPTFYKGRSIPATGGSVQLTALPFTGEARNPESYSYTWRVEDKVQGGGSRFGKNSINFTADFQKQITVSVDVIDTNGTVVTSESISVPLTDPELYFYEINPLRGMAEIAMNDNFIFVGEEIKVRAEPYFIDNALFSENPHQEWKLNNKVVANPNSDLQEITLRRSGDSGSFTLEYHIRNLKQLLQGVKDSVTVRF
jgi:hypothetical protein